MNVDEFIRRSKLKHGDKYDYSKSIYTRSNDKIVIICKEHGEFNQTAKQHIRGSGCKMCSIDRKRGTKESFIEKSILIHGDIYDYTKVEYVRNTTKVNIICKYHGSFFQTPGNHISGHKCIYCVGLNKKSNIDFLNELKFVHGDRYDYSMVNYINNISNIDIICREHGTFSQKAVYHLNGSICPKCNNDKNRKTTLKFIEESILVHGDRYNYSETKYVSSREKLKIICKKHGLFIQGPRLHLEGKGCPTCKQSKGERTISNYLKLNSIEFIPQKKFNKCQNIVRVIPVHYIPKYNICLEYNGRQHYQPVDIFGGNEGFIIQKIRDNIKSKYCIDNNIKLITIKYDENIEEILRNIIS